MQDISSIVERMYLLDKKIKSKLERFFLIWTFLLLMKSSTAQEIITVF